MIEKTGVSSEEDLARVTPSPERLRSGPVAIVECFQRIPCDPCVEACPKGAITIEGNINNLPVTDFELCNGCGLCISVCPGLAIFVVDMSYSDSQALVMLPHEFIPLPEKGEIVDALDREGRVRCEAEVTRVLNTKAQDRTPIISILVPKELATQVRSIRVHRSVVRRPYARRPAVRMPVVP